MSMRLPDTEHTSRPWRIHEIVPDFEVEDVWAFSTPGAGRDDFSVMLEALIDGGLDNQSLPSSVPVRDQVETRSPPRLGRSRAEHRVTRPITERTAARRQPSTGTAVPSTPFTTLYELGTESAYEMANKTVHSVCHLGWVQGDNGDYELRMAALVKPNGRFGRLYMAGIAPFRYFLVYPALTRQWERAWRDHYGLVARQPNENREFG